MTRYEIEEELDKLYKELETVKNADEETVCRAFNADSKQEYIDLIQDEIDCYEAILAGVEEPTCDEWDAHGFANEAEYLRYRFG